MQTGEWEEGGLRSTIGDLKDGLGSMKEGAAAAGGAGMSDEER